MSARDPETGQFMADDGGEDADYSTFEYQHFDILHEAGPDSSNDIQSNVAYEFEPLGSIGGLDSNEVAELVGYELMVGVESEDGAADQDVGTQAEARGVMGVNLSTSGVGDLFTPGADGNGEVTVINNDGVDASGSTFAVEERTDNARLQLWQAYGGPPFDDQTNGPGGGTGVEMFHTTRNYRGLVGRGPVVDYSDNMTFLQRLVCDDTVVPITGSVRGSFIWDVAEVNNAGRRFSVPR